MAAFGILSPEQALAQAQQRQSQEQMAEAQAFGQMGPSGMGYMAGQALGGAVGGMLGAETPESPEVTLARKQAEAAEELQFGDFDLTTEQGLSGAAKVMQKHGFLEEAYELAGQATSLKRAKTGGRGSFFRKEEVVMEDDEGVDRVYNVNVNTRTGEVDYAGRRLSPPGCPDRPAQASPGWLGCAAAVGQRVRRVPGRGCT